jgi:hypothetical protein
MATCASVARKGSTDQCPCRPLVGHTLCGVHARCKKVTLWATVNRDKLTAATRIQAIVRGWLLRNRLALAGPGVLRRRDLANDEDLETCVEASRQDPMTYFAFEEAGKVWWFDYATLWRWSQMSTVTVNPYTKVPLTPETRLRLRKVWSYRRRHGQNVPSDPLKFTDRLHARWTILCQIFADNGFGDVSPEYFVGLSRTNYILLFRLLRDDVQASLPTQRGALTLIHRCLVSAWSLPPTQFVLQCSYVLMAMLVHSRDPYPLAFCVLSALYRI